jgi:hypothetical protein
MQSVAIVETPSAKRYLGQFAKHFAHKLPVVLADDLTSGAVTFGAGICRLEATETKLGLILDGSEDAIAGLQDVVVRHLVRFAFREHLAVNWDKIGT